MPLSNLHSFRLRPYQRKLWDYLDDGGKRAIAIWPRRAGKDAVCLHWAAYAAMKRPANYWHMLPLQTQCKKAIWTARNPETGLRRIDEAFPLPLRAKTLEDEMMIILHNGSTWQCIGSDNYNSLVGSSPAGLVFSEWALSEPNSWIYLEPIVNAANGWALFVSTPRGENHCADMYHSAIAKPGWFAERLDAYDTKVFTEEQLTEAKQSYIDVHGEAVGLAYFRQEYLCSFSAALVGSYYGVELEKLETGEPDAEPAKPPQITDIAYDKRYPVHTVWDIGGTTAVIFFQIIGPKIHIIDYIESSGLDVSYYVSELKKRPYVYQQHIFPSDLEEQDDWSNARSRTQTLRSLGIMPRILPKQKSVNDGINSVHQILPNCWIDRTNCKRLIEVLKKYHRSWDDDRKVYSDKPYHDQYCHGADAMRYLAVSGVRNIVKRDLPAPRLAIV